MRRRFLALIIVLVVVALALAWRLSRDGSGRAPNAAGTSRPAGVEPQTDRHTSGPDLHSDPLRKEKTPSAARVKRDALYARILQTQAEQSAREAHGEAPAPRAEAPRPAGALEDRTGGREALAARLNQDFMPLVDECIELAQRDTPELAGMLVIGLSTLADKELGAVVDDVQLPASNQVRHPALLECVRETALSLSLPPPPGSGQDKFELSIPVKPRAQTPRDM